MRLLINVPKEFEQHFQADRFEDSLHRLSTDAHLLAGNYEQETAMMLIKMRYKDVDEITCPCCGEKTLRWARDRSYISDIPFIWIVCDTCDFDFGAEWKWTDYGDMLAEFKYYLKDRGLSDD